MDAMTVLEVDSSTLSRTVAFTGRLACMSREKAFDVVRQHGGTPSQTVTRQANVSANSAGRCWMMVDHPTS
jgi:NAD-dependent DNA ligase